MRSGRQRRRAGTVDGVMSCYRADFLGLRPCARRCVGAEEGTEEGNWEGSGHRYTTGVRICGAQPGSDLPGPMHARNDKCEWASTVIGRMTRGAATRQASSPRTCRPPGVRRPVPVSRSHGSIGQCGSRASGSLPTVTIGGRGGPSPYPGRGTLDDRSAIAFPRWRARGRRARNALSGRWSAHRHHRRRQCPP